MVSNGTDGIKKPQTGLFDFNWLRGMEDFFSKSFNYVPRFARLNQRGSIRLRRMKEIKKPRKRDYLISLVAGDGFEPPTFGS